MIAKPHTHEQVIQAEVAIEILNKARALVTERQHRIEDSDPPEAARLMEKQRQLYDLLRLVKVADDSGVAAVVQKWGPLVRDEDAFWREING